MRGVLCALALAGLVTLVPAAASAPAGSHAATVATASVDQQPTAQQPPKDVNVDINVRHSGGGWYRNPVWIAIGVIALVVLVILIVMAVGGGGGTTIVRD
jgi:hypothetical protein